MRIARFTAACGAGVLVHGSPAQRRLTPGDAAGGDSAADGSGQVDGNRLYQLIRQSGPVRERTFEIEFLDPGVHAYAFTFG